MIRETAISRSLRLMFSGGVALGLGLAAQAALAQQAAAPDQSVQRVEITGSSIKRVAGESALPVTVMNKADIERTGATTAQDLVSLIPSNFAGAVSANNVGNPGNPSTANLRGLGQNYTLVLLNGRRLSNFALGNNPVDLNSIPLSAIERIEVLKDGASSLYGADAIAGVINFILKKDYTGLEVSANKYKPSEHGGASESYNALGGYGTLDQQGFNVMLSVNHEHDQALKATDRSFAATGIRPDLGIAHTSPRNGIPNLNFSDTRGNNYGAQVNGANPVVAPAINPSAFSGCNTPGYAMAPVAGNPDSCQTDYVRFIDLIPKASHDAVVTRGIFKINEDHEAYAEAVYTKDKTDAAYSPAPYAGQPAGIPNMSYPTTGRFYPSSITIPAGTPLPAGYIMPDGTVLAAPTVLANNIQVTPNSAFGGRWRTVAGGGRHDLTEVKNTRLVIGVKGNIGGWDYDTGLTYSKNEGAIYFGPGQYSFNALSPILNSGQINIFGLQDAASAAALASAQLSGLENNATAKASQFDVRASKEIMQMSNGALSLALGASARKETLDQFSSPAMGSGDQVGGNGAVPGVTTGRKVYGMFAEATIPLMKDMELNPAVRYDNYKNDFGTSFSRTSPKISLRYQPEKTLLFRASYGQGFRAPTLYDNQRPFTNGNATTNNWSDPIRCPGGHPINNTVGALVDECNVQLTVANEGNPNLKPETSKQYSLGVVFQPTSSFSGSIDYWDVKIDDVIQYTPETQILNYPNAYVQDYYRFDPINDPTQLNPIKGSTNPNFPLAYIYEQIVNFGSKEAAGVDINLNYKLKVAEVGDFGLNLDGTWMVKHQYQYQVGGAVSDLGVTGDFGVTPRWRHALTGTFKRGPWRASLTHNYTSGYQDYTDPALVGSANYPAVRNVSAYSTFDATIGWSGVKNLDLTLGVKNLFDKDPPSSRAATGSGFQVGYDSVIGNPLGRIVYVNARYKFW